MSNTPNEDANANSGSGQNYGYPSQSTNYGSQQQGPYGPPNYPPPAHGGTPPNYPPPDYSGSSGNYPPPGYSSVPQGQQGPQAQYGVPPNYQQQYPGQQQGQYQQPYPGQQQGQYGYGANPEYDLNRPPGYGYNNLNMPPPASRPLPLAEAIRQLPGQYIRVTTKPSAATFAMEQGKAAWNIVWVQIIALAVFVMLIGFATVAVTGALLAGSSSYSATTLSAASGFLYAAPIAYLFLVPIGVFIGLGIYHLIAKAFGGTGTFLAYVYSYLLFSVPLTVLTSLIALIPFIGGLVAFAGSIYIIILQIFMTMGVHRLSGGRATLAVLILPIIGIVLGIIGFVVLFAVIASALQHAR